jgi:uncharacterized membrane protein (DUF485 family)
MAQEKREIEFIDTPEEVDRCYRAQLKLSITYGIIFFVSVLLIPYLSITSEWWYGKKIWGGFTLNYLVVALLFHIFYVLLAYFYVKQANALEDKLLGFKEGEVTKHD